MVLFIKKAIAHESEHAQKILSQDLDIFKTFIIVDGHKFFYLLPNLI